jgi:sensor histidine kinase regulating citrate/malate metabolism
MIEKWDTETSNKIEKWMAYIGVPVLIALTIGLIAVSINIRSTVLSEAEQRANKAATQQAELIGELQRIHDQLETSDEVPSRSESYRRIQRIEDRLDRIIERAESGSLDNSPP